MSILCRTTRERSSSRYSNVIYTNVLFAVPVRLRARSLAICIQSSILSRAIVTPFCRFRFRYAGRAIHARSPCCIRRLRPPCVVAEFVLILLRVSPRAGRKRVVRNYACIHGPVRSGPDFKADSRHMRPTPADRRRYGALQRADRLAKSLRQVFHSPVGRDSGSRRRYFKEPDSSSLSHALQPLCKISLPQRWGSS